MWNHNRIAISYNFIICKIYKITLILIPSLYGLTMVLTGDCIGQKIWEYQNNMHNTKKGWLIKVLNYKIYLTEKPKKFKLNRKTVDIFHLSCLYIYRNKFEHKTWFHKIIQFIESCKITKLFRSFRRLLISRAALSTSRSSPCLGSVIL